MCELSDQPDTQRIVVAGAGSIGCFVGGLLANAGHRVSLLARPRTIAAIRQHGLHLTSLEGLDIRVAEPALEISDDLKVLAGAAVVLVTVKSTDTAEMADFIAAHAASDAIVISLQNGIDNVPTLRRRLPAHRVLAGVVPFNVIAPGDGHFHRATSGDIMLERDAADTAARLSVPGLPMHSSANIVGVQWGKLLMNLNNALNALSGLTLVEQFAQRGWRVVLAGQMRESLAALRAEGIKPVAATPIPPALVSYLLRLPDGLFQVLLGRAMKIDPSARSSMWEDLQLRRRTEIDYLQGAIIAIAERRGLDVALTRRIETLVKRAEAAGQGSPALTPEQFGAGSA